MMEGDKKRYLDHFYPKWGEDDFIPCEVCGRGAVDLHHIEPKQMGGTTRNYTTDDLMMLCRKCHSDFHDGGTITKEELKNYHQIFIEWRKLV